METTATTKVNGNGGVVVATVLIVVLVIAIAVVVILLVFASGGTTGSGASIDINSHIKGNENMLQAAKPLIQYEQQKQQQYPSQNISQAPARPVIPKFKAIGDLEGSSKCNKSNPGIMNSNPEAQAKKWDPAKNFPTRNPPVRPDNTLGSKFGPSETEMQMYLPTAAELFAAKGHISGPKKIRRGPRYRREVGDWRPLQIPEDYKDYDRVRRPNRPRIDENYFAEAIELDKRHWKSGMPGVVPAKC